MNLFISRSGLLLFVAAFSLLALVLVKRERTATHANPAKANKTANKLSYSRSPNKSDNAFRPDQSSQKAKKQPNKRTIEDSYLSDLRKLAQESPLDAVKQVLEMAPDANQRRAMALVFNEWAQHDPDAAAQWIMQNLSIPQQLRMTAAASLANAWVRSSPDEAMPWAHTYFNQTDDHSPFQNALNTWAKEDTDAVGRHLASEPYDGDIGYLATVGFVNIYAQKDLRKAQEWMEAYVPQDLQSDAQAVLIHQLAKKDPKEAARYVLQEDNLVNIQSNLDALLFQWINTNPAAAAEWVEQSLNPSQQEMAFGQLVELFRDQQPEVAIQYVQALNNDKFRIDTTTDVLTDWRNQNATAADQWISENLDNLEPSILEDIDYVDLAPQDP